MSAWLCSIVGVIFLGVLIDIIYPNGKTNAFCKSIFGIFAVIVIISPILKLDINHSLENTYSDKTLASTIQTSKDNVNVLVIEQSLKNQGITNVFVEINSIMQNNEYEIENVLIDASQVVLNKDMEHTYMYKVILESVTNAIQIESEKVIIYG